MTCCRPEALCTESTECGDSAVEAGAGEHADMSLVRRTDDSQKDCDNTALNNLLQSDSGVSSLELKLSPEGYGMVSLVFIFVYLPPPSPMGGGSYHPHLHQGNG